MFREAGRTPLPNFSGSIPPPGVESSLSFILSGFNWYLKNVVEEGRQDEIKFINKQNRRMFFLISQKVVLNVLSCKSEICEENNEFYCHVYHRSFRVISLYL